jgi:ABC-2 type transport system permease protein
LLELFRNMGVLAIVLSVPIVETFVLAYATSGGVRDLPTAIHDLDRSATSRQLIAAFDNSRCFAPHRTIKSLAEGERLLDEGAVTAVVAIPNRFEASLARPGDEATVLVLMDGSNASVAGLASVYAEEIVGDFAGELSERVGHRVEAQTQVWFNEDLRRENFYIPAQLGAMMTLIILALTSISIVRERERGTLEQLMVSPIRPFELITGKLIPSFFIAHLELAAMLLIAFFWFNVPFKGSLPLFLILVSIYIVVEMSVGILISTLAQSQGQALLTAFLTVNLAGTLAGYLIPIDSMPAPARLASTLVPLKYFVVIARGILIKGSGLALLVPQLAPMVLVGAVFFLISASQLRKGLA